MTIGNPSRDDAGRAAGIGFMLMAAVCFSTGGLITRHVEAADGWQVMFYRAVGMVATLTLVLLVKERGRVVAPFKAIGRGGLAVAAVIAVSMVSYVFAMLLTSVANAQFVMSSAPFFAALLGLLVLREPVHRTTWLAIMVAIVGMGVMFADGFAAGPPVGLFVALLAGSTYGLLVVMLRQLRALDMLPALIVAGLFAGAASALMAEDLAVSANDMLAGLFMGVVQTATGFACVMLATRRIPAAEAGLLLLADTILGPIWVWLFVNEVPAPIALVGGLIVLAAVLLQAIASVVWERRALGNA